MADHNKDILTTTIPLSNTGKTATLLTRFFATVLPVDKLIGTLTADYLLPRGIDPGAIAILSESDTAYGAGADVDDGTKWIRFPMHIGSMRSAYAQDANLLLGKGAGQASEPHLSLDLSLQNTDEALHLLPLLAPASINQIEASLISELAELYERRLSAVVIAATDPRDQIFLSRLVKTYAPQTMTILVSADSLFIHDMDGVTVDEVLVATPYPLTANVQRYTGEPDAEPAWAVFRNQTAEGIYNAVVALLAGEIEWEEGGITDSKRLRDYRLPFRQSNKAEFSGPPLWVTVIRHNQFWPVACYPVAVSPDSYTLAAIDQPVKDGEPGRPGYGPSRYVSLAVVGAVFSAWAIYRCAFYFSFSGWLTATREYPLLAVSSVWELVVPAATSWLLVLPFLLNLSLLFLSGNIGRLYQQWSWCLFAAMLLLTLIVTSYNAVAHGATTIAEWQKAGQLKWLSCGLTALLVPLCRGDSRSLVLWPVFFSAFVGHAARRAASFRRAAPLFLQRTARRLQQRQGSLAPPPRYLLSDGGDHRGDRSVSGRTMVDHDAGSGFVQRPSPIYL